MKVSYRDAREDDADDIAEIANSYVMSENLSVGSMRDLVQDRTMKVAEVEGEEEEDGDDVIVGYVSYHAVEETVVVQHICVVPEYRDTEVPERLVSFPVEFAGEEGMKTRAAVNENSWFTEFLPTQGFEEKGEARFAGETLVMYEV
jgi:N-acetylglutamate synthase-like GNAT family acetyltransferase